MSRLVTAFDASGHESDQLILVVAGFLSSAQDWEKFTLEWKARLVQDGLDYFHMKKFKRWDADEMTIKQPLLSSLMEIAKGNTYRKFGTVVINKTFRGNFSETDKKRWLLNAYSLAAANTLDDIEEWTAMQPGMQKPIEHFFEEGDLGRNELDGLARERGYRVSFRPGKTIRNNKAGNPVYPFVPLQAADFLAAEYFMEAERRLKSIEKRPRPRWGYLQFEEKIGEIRVFNDESTAEFRNVLEITKEFDEFLNGER